MQLHVAMHKYYLSKSTLAFSPQSRTDNIDLSARWATVRLRSFWVGYCPVGYCPVSYCPVGYCPVGYCPPFFFAWAVVEHAKIITFWAIIKDTST